MKPHAGAGLKNSRGQVGLVLVLLAALGLVFYAMTMNLGKISSSKTRTMIAAESSASFMASFMASYAQLLSEENLKGKLKYCDSTSLLTRIITVVVLVALIVFAGPLSLGFVSGHMGYFVAAAVFATASAVVDAAVLEPLITSKWAQMMSEVLTIEGQMIEYGIQTALMASANDNIEFPDLTDEDMDGVFGWKDVAGHPGVPDYTKPADKMSRIGYYYTERLKLLKAPEMGPLKEFANQLEDFILYEDQDDDREGLDPADPDDTKHDVFGIHDSVVDNPHGHICLSSDASDLPAECNPQCVGERAKCCDISGCSEAELSECSGSNPPPCCSSCSDPPSGDPDPSCELPGRPDGAIGGNCSATSYIGPDPSEYPYVYDPFYEDTTNDIFSLREMIGRDDESPSYEVNPLSPDWHNDAARIAASHQTLRTGIDVTNGTSQGPKDWYHIEDTTGFYKGDSQQGVYPLFYTMRDITVSFSDLGAPPYQDYECYWKGGSCPVDPATSLDSMGVYESEYKNSTRLFALHAFGTPDPGDGSIVLSQINSADPITLLAGNTTEVGNLGAGGAPDQVPGIPSFFGDDFTCGYDATAVSFQWQRGIDKFCSKNDSNCSTDSSWYCYNHNYPYHTECAKHGVSPQFGTYACNDPATGDGGDTVPYPRDCYCGEGGAWPAKFFPSDALDVMSYGLEDFLSWAADLLEKMYRPDYAAIMRKGITRWYDEAADWIERPCDKPSCKEGDKKCCKGSYTKKERAGLLYQWVATFDWFQRQLYDWMYPDSTTYPTAYQGGSCAGSGAAWCIPEAMPAGTPNEYGIDECPGISPEEQATFNVNVADPDPRKQVRGDVEDVVACLEWNVSDEHVFIDETGSGQTAVGDQEKFQQCADHCGPWACSVLPRHLVSLTGPYAGIDLSKLGSYWSDKEKYMYCLNSASYGDCLARCTPDSGVVTPGPLPMSNSVTAAAYSINPADYTYPSMTEIDAIQADQDAWLEDCKDGSFDSGNFFIDCNDPLFPDYLVNSCALSHLSGFSSCMDSWGGSCEAFVNRGAAALTGDTQFYTDAQNIILNNEADDSTGFCHEDLDASGTADFIEWARDNARASENLVKKLKQRLRFLKYVFEEAARVREVFRVATCRFLEFLNNGTVFEKAPDISLDDKFVGVLSVDPDTAGSNTIDCSDLERDVEWWDDKTSETSMDDGANVYTHYKVDSPAELLVAMRQDDEDKDLPSVVVYVWRGPDLDSDKARSDGSRKGYVHAVKVEVRGPKRCNFACNASMDGYQPWPTIETKTYNSGTKRCFYMKNYTGTVKARVIRYDEPVDRKARVFRFANNVPIWGMSTTHPDAGPGNPNAIFIPGSECYSQINPYIKQVGEKLAAMGNPAVPMYLHHAFMLNRPPSTAAPWNNPATTADDDQYEYDECWKAVHQNMLVHGVHSESCARYLWEGRDFGVRFVPCDQKFLSGNN